MKIKSDRGNEAEDRTDVHQGKLTTDNFIFEGDKFIQNDFIPFSFLIDRFRIEWTEKI
ncbi:hypothetical protein SHY80_04605 [Streptococcus suis]|nr:hypothetical protein [Streptococcus suis]HEL1796667.1 hypothetical protein [Streptococcus suis]HEM5566131.1 hypothetical protein [Streptococcus suis]